MNSFKKSKVIYILVVILILVGGLYILTQNKDNSGTQIKTARKQYADDVKNFKEDGSVEVVQAVTYGGTKTFAKPKSEEKIVAIEILIQPQNAAVSLEDLAIHDKNEKFLTYGWPEVNLDNKDKDKSFKQHSKDSYVVLFLVPKDFREGSLVYSDRKFAEIKLTN